MSRFSGGGSYGHRIYRERRRGDEFAISWTVDFYYSGSRLRFPRAFRRETDEAGAQRFAKKWGLAIPEPGKSSPY